MRSRSALAALVFLVLSTGLTRHAHAQGTPAARVVDDPPGLGTESPTLARMRDAEPDRAPLPRTVAEAATLEGTTLPDGLDRDLASRLQMPALPMRLTPRLAESLARFRTDRNTRRNLAGWFRRAGRYRVRIEALLASEGLPADLVWVVAAESGFDPGSTSWVGAAGLWQFMPDTARSYGLRVDAWVDERRDPERATRAAAHLLRDLYTRFGTWDLALAAYNMGYGALLRTIRKYNTNDFERVASLEAGLPFETTTYVPRILATAISAHNVDAFGLGDVTQDAPITWEDLTVMRSVPLDALARAIGMEPAALRSLNPALAGARTPPCDDLHPFVLHVPLGLGPRAMAWIDQTRQPELRAYTLRHGETLDEIASRFGLASDAALLAVSGFGPTTRVEAGSLLLVPARDPSSPAPAERPVVAIEPAQNPPPGRRRVFYHVAPGESVRDISAALGVARDELLAWNALDAAARLQTGLWLQAYVTSAPVDARIWEAAEVTVVERGSEAFYDQLAASVGRVRRRVIVRDGDSMRSVAERYGLTVGSLARINHRSRRATLTAGEEIIVYAAPEERPASARSSGAPDELGHDDVPPPSPSSGAPAGAAQDEASEPESGPVRQDGSASAAP